MTIVAAAALALGSQTADSIGLIYDQDAVRALGVSPGNQPPTQVSRRSSGGQLGSPEPVALGYGFGLRARR